jgi:hypothetical protein
MRFMTACAYINTATTSLWNPTDEEGGKWKVHYVVHILHSASTKWPVKHVLTLLMNVDIPMLFLSSIAIGQYLIKYKEKWERLVNKSDERDEESKRDDKTENEIENSEM